MKTLLTLLTLAFFSLPLHSCKKDKTKPADPEPVVVTPTYTPKTSGAFEGKYFTTTTSKQDTIGLTFVKDNYPENTIRYKITNLGKAFNDWATPIPIRDYYVNISEGDNFGSISDTLNVK